MWYQVLEGWLLNKLIRSPSFHKGVGFIHKRYMEMRFGKNVEDMGGTKLDSGKESFLSHFAKEIKQQARGKPTKL